MPRALPSLTKNSPNVSSWSKNLLKFPFINNTLLSINNTKIFQVYNKPLSCTRIQSRLQFLLHKGYIMGPKWRRKMMTDLTLYIYYCHLMGKFLKPTFLAELWGLDFENLLYGYLRGRLASISI